MIRISDREHLDRTVKMIHDTARRRRGQVFFRMEAGKDGGLVRVKRRYTTKVLTWKQAREQAKYGGIDSGARDMRL